jgi:hypothetical protein
MPMYKLRLSRDERLAFDFVGFRYCTGDQVANVLKSCLADDDERWYGSLEDITISLPEPKAWEVFELSESEGGLWPLFGTDLVAKLTALTDAIV